MGAYSDLSNLQQVISLKNRLLSRGNDLIVYPNDRAAIWRNCGYPMGAGVLETDGTGSHSGQIRKQLRS